MKKPLTCLLTLALAVGTYAADAYNFGWGKDVAYLMNKGTSTNIGVLRDSSLTFQFTSNNTGSTNINFGVFTYDLKKGVLKETVYEKFGTEILSATQNFESGDLVGMWLEVDGKKIYSIHGMNENGVTKDGWKIVGGDLNFGFETNSPYYGKFESLDFFLTVSGDSPAGQPLPGVIATILVGGALGAAYKFKRKKA